MIWKKFSLKTFDVTELLQIGYLFSFDDIKLMLKSPIGLFIVYNFNDLEQEYIDSHPCSTQAALNSVRVGFSTIEAF